MLFYAGSARYLLPLAAPLALLVANQFKGRRIWIYGAFGANLVLSLALAYTNYQHWDGYRRFAREVDSDIISKRVWIDGEWGLRYYAETRGALPLERGQAVLPDEEVISSSLAYPTPSQPAADQLAPAKEMEIRASIPLAVIGLGTHSGYSTVGFGCRPFDIQFGPLDRVRLETVMERTPTLSWLEMNSPEAARPYRERRLPA